MALLPANLVCWPGKVVRLEPVGIEVTVAALAGPTVEFDGADGCDPASVMAISARCVAARAWLGASLVRAEHGRLRGRVEAARPWNLREGPRAVLRSRGTYYLHGFTLGVPMVTVDVSVGGVAIEAPDGVRDAPGTVRAVSFDVSGRLVRAVAEVVGVGDEVWRLRFVHLSPGDEAAVARWVFARQVSDRAALGPSARLDDGLDASAQLLHPRLSVRRRGRVVEVAVEQRQAEPVTFALGSPDDVAALDRWCEAVGPWLRLGAWWDVAWMVQALPASVAGELSRAIVHAAADHWRVAVPEATTRLEGPQEAWPSWYRPITHDAVGGASAGGDRTSD
ncbi:type IV pilus assembly PilZ [Acidimicrobium ferrooxidans DSM 10331]|uniref:Type IV pilus assembly PilZ n=1 Tax=Acidimicrobium ferrooxidans (strain DSM 10331 / JCM 15462 / NBRC 103882 / ICP) TaxID=525909 RepID=C7M1V3_ACIFD|nr:PilZ domain-containing protein [Acidimicrobium ferrooxidans]ACU54850.1 type IV pilus assembly PilZ [Acidimicrobium ferrooxidans DSM 10331]